MHRDLVPSRVLVALLLAGCTAGGTVGDGTEPTQANDLALAGTPVTFQTTMSGQFLCAENGGGGAVSADRGAAQGWETFGLVDQNGGALQSGDLVFLQTSSGQYLMAQDGGGGALVASSPNQLDWESFRVVKQGGSGAIQGGDVVGLQTKVSGKWISATNGGGSTVNANGAALSTWEAFRIGMSGGAPPPPPPPPPPNTWHLVWQDEFDGNALDESKWSYEVQRPGWVTHELENYTTRRPENVRVENGHLVIEGRRDWFGGYEYSSGRIKTQGHASWTYGRVEARMQLPGGWGTWPAFWMMPDDFSRGWPACGEIDIMEEVGYDQDNVHATTHSLSYNWQRPEQRTSTYGVGGMTTAYHVYAAEWTTEGIDFYVDGHRYFTSPNDHTGDDAWPFHKRFYVILNLAIGGDWGGARGVDPNIWPRQMLVDYVRVYQK